jgi:hypothetical protein
VLAELISSRRSEEPEAGGDKDERSLSRAISASWFIATRTEAASNSCTCWCLEMSSLEVNCHSGVCSQLKQKSTQNFKRQRSGARRGWRKGHSS